MPKKAAAPRPVEGGREEQEKKLVAAQTVHEITARGVVLGRIAMQNVPMRDKTALREQRRMPWHHLLGEPGVEPDVTNYATLVWLARRGAGEPDLSWLSFSAGWDDTIRIDECNLVEVDPANDDGADDPQP